MEDLFLTVLNRGIAAGFLVLAAVLLRLLLRRAPKNFRLLLWGFVALRLLLPAAMKSPVGLAPSAQTIPPEAVYAAAPAIDSGIPAVDAAVNPVMAASLSPTPFSSANPMQIWLFVGAQVWRIGLIGMLLYMFVSTLLLRRRVADSVPLRANIRLSERIATPFVLGLFRPRIYLPVGMDEETMALVLAHEQGHITRHDHWLKPFGFLLLSVWWFQPLLWLAYALFCRDLELACDEFVLRQLGEKAKKPYARALVSCGAGGHVAACPVAFGAGEVKSRVKAALRWKPVSRWMLLLLIPLCVLLGLLFLTDREGRREEPAAIDSGAVETPTPEQPEAGEASQDQKAPAPPDPLALLRGFSGGQVLTVYDRTGQAYFPPLRSFGEIIEGASWSVNDDLHSFPASDPDRLIELLADGRVLRIEDDGSGDLLYMIYDADGSGDGDVLYLDGGDGLMDELMAWAAEEKERPPMSGEASADPAEEDSERIRIVYYYDGQERTEVTMAVGETLLLAAVRPDGSPVLAQWEASSGGALSVEPKEGSHCTVTVLDEIPDGAVVTARCDGAEAQIKIYIVSN